MLNEFDQYDKHKCSDTIIITKTFIFMYKILILKAS